MPLTYSWSLPKGNAAFTVASPGGGGGGETDSEPTTNQRYIRAGATGAATGLNWTDAFTSLPATRTRDTTYWFADGSYSGATLSTAASGTQVIRLKKATVAIHGTDTGWDNTYGDGVATFSSGFDINSNYWTIDGSVGGGIDSWDSGHGFKITETGDSTAVIRLAFGTSGVGFLKVKHCELQGKGSVSSSGGFTSNDGFGLYAGAHDIEASYCWMHGIGRCHIFWGTGGTGASTWQHNHFDTYFGSGGVHSELMSTGAGENQVGDTTFRYNLVTSIESTGGLMWNNASSNTTSLWVYGNIFYRATGVTWSNANGVIGGWSGGSGEQMHNVKVYNNTFINVNVESLSTLPATASGCEASNNLFYNCQSPDFAKFPTHNYNHFINSGGTHSEANGTSAASGDPFVDYVNLNFRLTSATTAGTTLSSPFNSDPYGNTRGSDSTWDRGAIEKT